MNKCVGEDAMVKLEDIDFALAEILLDNVLGKKGVLTYTEVAVMLTEKLGREIKPHGTLSKPLGTVSELCFELGLPLISARVIYSSATDAKIVGEGFYPFACGLKPEYKSMSPVDAWKNELGLIRECKNWDRLRNYLYGMPEPIVVADTAPAADHNLFAQWLGENTSLSYSSIVKYSGAVGTVSREMLEEKIISRPLQNMDPFELDLAINSIMRSCYFIDKNTRGNHMYSNALKQYRYFINATCEESKDTEYINGIRADATIPETEREAIIQSRVGQGLFRKALFDKYHGSCIITGIDHPKLLVASHIKPWAVSTNRERLSADNGLLLSATYDRLFDCGLITFDKAGKLYLSSFIGTENVKRLHLSNNLRFNLRLSGSMGEFLEYHNDVLFVK